MSGLGAIEFFPVYREVVTALGKEPVAPAPTSGLIGPPFDFDARSRFSHARRYIMPLHRSIFLTLAVAIALFASTTSHTHTAVAQTGSSSVQAVSAAGPASNNP